MANTEIYTLPDDDGGCYTSLFIRCWGEHEQIKYYLVYGTDNDGESKILYKLRVNEEMEQVDLCGYNSNIVVLATYGGLFDNCQELTVVNASKDTVIAMVNSEHITTSLEITNPYLTVNWRLQRSARYDTAIKSLVIKDQSGLDIATIYGNNQSSAVAITISKVTLSHLYVLKRVLVILAAFKLYYCLHHYHEQPVPAEIPSMMPAAAPSPPDLCQLRRVAAVRMRLSCMNHSGDSFVEVLDQFTRRILFVVEIIGRSNALIFTDLFGKIQLTAHETTDRSHWNILVFDHAQTCLGTIDKQNFTISSRRDGEIFDEQLVKPTPFQLCKLQIPTLVSQKTGLFAASYYLESRSNDVILNMLETMDVDKKALMLTRALGIAIVSYKMTKDTMLPVVADYQYRTSTEVTLVCRNSPIEVEQPCIDGYISSG